VTPPDKKPKTAFNQNAENYIRDPKDVARAIAAVKARAGSRRDDEKNRAEAEKQDAFKSYHRLLEPVFKILEELPRDKNNYAFFIRRDLNEKATTAQKTLQIWMIYGRHRTAPMSATPDTHSVTFASKNQTDAIEKSAPRIRVALGTAPVLHILQDAPNHIESTVYKERYVRDHSGEALPGRRGDFIEKSDILSKQAHREIKETLEVIHGWIKTVAPERVVEIRKALSVLEQAELRDDIQIKRPLTLKKPQGHGPKTQGHGPKTQGHGPKIQGPQ